MERVSELINIYSFIPTILVAIYTLIVYRKLSYELKVFAWFIFFSGIIELISKAYSLKRMNNLPLLHLYVAAGFCFVAYFYQVILKDIIDKRIIPVVTVCFLIFTIINSLFLQPLLTFNSYALTVQGVIMVILSLSTYILMMDRYAVKKVNQLTTSLNWINSGLFAYYSSSLLIFHYGYFITLIAPSYLTGYVWILHAFFSCVMYCCFFAALWNRPRK